MYGKHNVRLKSGGGKQTAATKAQQAGFARATAIAVAVRRLVQSAIPNPTEKAMQNRLTQTLIHWVNAHNMQQPLCAGAVTALQGFPFIAVTNFSGLFRLPVQIQHTQNAVQVLLPAFIPSALLSP